MLHRELVPSPLIVSGFGNYGDVNNLKPMTCSAQMVVGLEAWVQTRPDHRDGFFLKRGDILLSVHEKSLPADTIVFLSTHLVGCFSGREKRRPEIRLCPQANWMYTKKLCLTSGARVHKPAMLRRWPCIQHPSL